MVKVYGKPGCGGCVATVRDFNKYDIDFEYVNVSEDEAAFDYVINTLGYQGVPVVETPTEHWNGYKSAKIKELI